MKELIRQIKTVYKYFNNENYVFFAIFLISVLYIFLTEKDKKKKDFFVWYTAVIFLVIWNPICIWILNKFINFSSMYRIYYMLPILITIAYAGVKVIEDSSKYKKMIATLLISGIIVLVGKNIFSEGKLMKFSNHYKLPDEDVEVAYIISSDEETDYKKAIVPYGMSSRIRQVKPDIKLVYTRIVSSPKDADGNVMPTDSEDPTGYEPVEKFNVGDVEFIANLCEETNTNYVVFPKATELSDDMENHGFELYSETLNYDIYRAKKD